MSKESLLTVFKKFREYHEHYLNSRRAAMDLLRHGEKSVEVDGMRITRYRRRSVSWKSVLREKTSERYVNEVLDSTPYRTGLVRITLIKRRGE